MQTSRRKSKRNHIKILVEGKKHYSHRRLVPNYIEQQYPTVSTTPIPLYLDDALSNVYNDQLKNGIQLSVDIYPNILNCMNHYPFCDPVPARPSKGIIIYTESDVIYLPEHQGI